MNDDLDQEDYFIDLGAGFFLFEEFDFRKSCICDSLAEDPDHLFGPAAWAGKQGPLSGKTILEACAVLNGSWVQVGEDEAQWFADSDINFEKPYNEEPASWPRRIVVVVGLESSPLAVLKDHIFATEAELVEAMIALTAKLPDRVILSGDGAIRMANCQFAHPHIFGEPIPAGAGRH